ncbi:MAG: zinc ribbon domain-containing protein [Smithellaceae bacterium]
MPTYEYECGACGQRFERFQTISDAPVTECPDCHGEVKRLLSGGGGFIMKGRASGTRAHASNCDRETPCCGRAERCDTPPCH